MEDVGNQMLELYDQIYTGQPSQANEVEGSTGGETNQPATATSTISESSVSVNRPAQDAGGVDFKHGGQRPQPARPVGSRFHAGSRHFGFQSAQKSNDKWSVNSESMVCDHDMDTEGKYCSCHEMEKFSGCKESTTEVSSCPRPTLDLHLEDTGISVKRRAVETKEWMDESSLALSSCTGGWDSKYGETAEGYCPPDSITKIDKGKVKAALERRRKLLNAVAKKSDIMDEDDLIEREIENGIELVVEDEKIKQEIRSAWPKPLNKKELNSERSEQTGIKEMRNFRVLEQQASQRKSKFRSSSSEDKTASNHVFEPDQPNAEQRELSSLDEHEFPFPKCCSSNGKVTNTRYQSRAASETRQLHGVKRSRDDHEYLYPEVVSEKAMGMGKHPEGMQQYENSHSLLEATGKGCF